MAHIVYHDYSHVPKNEQVHWKPWTRQENSLWIWNHFLFVNKPHRLKPFNFMFTTMSHLWFIFCGGDNCYYLFDLEGTSAAKLTLVFSRRFLLGIPGNVDWCHSDLKIITSLIEQSALSILVLIGWNKETINFPQGYTHSGVILWTCSFIGITR